MTAVQYESRSNVAYITLASPDSGNVLSLEMLLGISQSVGRSNEDTDCHAIVIRTAGGDFCKGMDFETLLCGGPDAIAESCKDFLDCLETISTSSKPVIACVDGTVAGGGVGLVAACDIVIAAEAARFALPEVIVGMIPAVIVPFLLQRMTIGRIRYMALSSRSLTAMEARDAGLVDEVGHPDMQEALNRQLGRLLRSSPDALSATKAYLRRLDELVRTEQTEIAMATLGSWLQRPEAMEGVRAFAKGFSPPWFQKHEGI